MISTRTIRWNTICLLLLAGALGCPPGVLAQEALEEPLVTDRPDFTESTATVVSGRRQFEGGYTFSRQGSVKTHALGELLFRIGAWPNTEIRLAANSYVWSEDGSAEREGLEDVELGAKVELLQGGGSPGSLLPAVSLLAQTTLPTGDIEIGQDEVQPRAILALAWDLTETVSLGSNLGYKWAIEGDNRFSELSLSAAVGVGVAERVGAFFEFFMFEFSDIDAPSQSFLDTGLTLLLNRDLQADLRVGFGLDDPDPNYFVGAGLAWRR